MRSVLAKLHKVGGQEQCPMTLSHPYLVIILTGHYVGERDLSFEHFPAVHELHQQVADSLELHPLGWFYI